MRDPWLEIGHNAAMTREAPTIQLYEAVGRLRRGGEGQLEAHGLVAPFDASAGRVDNLAGPADLLCAALSACMLKNVERFSQLLPFRYESATILVVAEREDSPPRIVRMRYELEIVTDESAARVELLHRNIEKFGTITNTLSRACEVTGTVTTVGPS
ncbi:MAG: OsmC family protein [Kofleriaceae bacterium]